MRKSLLVLSIALVVSGLALAGDYVPLANRLTPEQLHATGLDTLKPEQLAALDALLRDEKAATPAPVAATETPKSLAEREHEGSLLGLSDQPIHARAQGAIDGWQPGTVFTLDNGQQWKVLKGEMKLRKLLQAPEILVVPGVAGRWFLQVDPDLPKARVYRID